MIRFLFRNIGKPLRILPPKLIQNKKLGVRTPALDIPVNRFIEFKHYTGNEIIYSLKEFKKLKPGEFSSALLQLGLRKGLPEGFDWNTHPRIQQILPHIIENIPRYTCRVLTSLALALSRLEIKNDDLWKDLAFHIIRTITSIESVGLAYCFSSFNNKGFESFYKDLIEILPVHLPHITAKDFLNIVKGLVKENIETDVFLTHLYPYTLAHIKDFSVSQLELFLKLTLPRNDYPEEFLNKVRAEISKKLSSHSIISFGGKVHSK